MSRKFTNVNTTDIGIVLSTGTLIFYLLSFYYYSPKLGFCCLGDIQIQKFTVKGLRQQFLVVLHEPFNMFVCILYYIFEIDAYEYL